MRIFLLLLSILTAADSFCQSHTPSREVEATDDGIIVTYRFNGAFYQEDLLHEGSTFVKIPGFALCNIAGKPCVPFKWDSFVVPDDVEVNVTLIDSAYTDTTLVLAPSLPPISMNDTLGYTADRIPQIEPYNGFFPESAVKLGDIQNYRGQDIAKIATLPVQYDFRNHTVRSYSMVKYMVSFSKNGNRIKGKDYVSNKADTRISLSDNFLENSTLNYSMSTNGKKNISGYSLTRSNNDALLDNRSLLIITTHDFLSSVNNFADWKRTLGHNVFVESKPKGYWNCTGIKQLVSQYYNNTIQSRPLYYLLLVGDIDFVPSCPDSIIYSPSVTAYYDSDFLYCCIDGGQIDFNPDIMCGRIPVCTNDEATAVFDKIRFYEKNPITDEDFYNTFACSSFFQDTSHPDSSGFIYNGADGFEDTRATLTSEEIIEYLSDKNKTGIRIYKKSNPVTPRGWNNTYFYDGSLMDDSLRYSNVWSGDSTKISQTINNGTFLFSYIGHGSFTCWLTPQYDETNITALHNTQKYPVVFSMACETGRFNYATDCLAEQFLKKGNGGAVGVIAPTYETPFGYTEMLDEYCIDAIWPNPGLNVKWHFDEDTCQNNNTPVFELGRILNQALYRMSNFTLTNTYSQPNPLDGFGYIYQYELIRKIFHIFGDPSMCLYTDNPVSFYKPDISYSNGTITIDTNDSDSRISFYEHSAVPVVNSYIGNHVNYSTNANHVTICINKHNKIPYIVDFYKDEYIQNELIDNNRVYASPSSLKIGKSVTTNKPEGNVCIMNADVKINAQRIELHSGTSIINSNVKLNAK